MSLIAVEQMNADERQRVADAVAEAERGTDGEIVTIVADRSDHYADVPLFWAGGASLLALSVLAAFPELHDRLFRLFTGSWGGEPSHQAVLLTVFSIAVAKFLAVWLLLQWMPLRMLLTPRDIKLRRVRRRAVELFRIAVEGRTKRRTGILIYLSMCEHRAEIVTDASIAAKVPGEAWGDMMTGMLHHVRRGETGTGLAVAVRQAGDLLARHVPKRADNPNELPDSVIEL